MTEKSQAPQPAQALKLRQLQRTADELVQALADAERTISSAARWTSNNLTRAHLEEEAAKVRTAIAKAMGELA